MTSSPRKLGEFPNSCNLGTSLHLLQGGEDGHIHLDATGPVSQARTEAPAPSEEPGKGSLQRPGSGVRKEKPRVSQTLMCRHHRTEAQWGQQGAVTRPAGHPHHLPQSSPRRSFQIPSSHGPGDRAQIREGKNKFFVLRKLLPFPTSTDNSGFVSSEANDRETHGCSGCITGEP